MIMVSDGISADNQWLITVAEALLQQAADCPPGDEKHCPRLVGLENPRLTGAITFGFHGVEFEIEVWDTKAKQNVELMLSLDLRDGVILLEENSMILGKSLTLHTKGTVA